jgi:hypothetical protein
MTKFYIVLADSAFVGVCFPAQQARVEAGVGCLAFVRATMVGVWHFSLTLPPLSSSFSILRYIVGDCSLRHRNDEVPWRARSGVFGCCTDLLYTISDVGGLMLWSR